MRALRPLQRVATEPGARAATELAALSFAAFGLVSCVSGGGATVGVVPSTGTAPAAGPAEIRVVYPPAGATLTASDSTFIFGSVTPASALVTVNGVPARQASGGGWLAWVPIAPGAFSFQIEAPGTGARLDWPVRAAGGFTGSWLGLVDSSSVTPRETLELEPGDPLLVRFKAVAGLRGRAVLGKGLASAPLVETEHAEANAGRSTFGELGGAGGSNAPRSTERTPDPDVSRSDPAAGRDAGWSWYATELVVPVPAPPAWAFGSSAPLAVEIDGSGSTRRLELPARVFLRDPSASEVAFLDDDLSRKGHTDGTVVGRTAPDGTYVLFLPNGTHASTARRVGDAVELRLARDLSVWSSAAEVHPLPEGTPRPASRVPVIRTRRLDGWTRIRVPLDEPLPVQIRQQAAPVRYQVTIFGARAATEFVRTDFGDPLVREIRWSQPTDDRFVLDVELNQRQPWGYRYGYDGTDFYLDVRRSPELRSGLFHSILKGLKIVVDPGHSPDSGARGPTGLEEKDVNLQVAVELARQLDDAGAEVILTRLGEAPEGATLNDRTNLAAREEADLLVSVHHNALPDGVNPFRNNGSSTYYYQPQSLPLARAIQAELLKRLGLPDFGVAFGNLALARPTAMPAVLVEAAFMMIPEQEALLRTEDFREREATAIRKGIERFLEDARRNESEGGP